MQFKLSKALSHKHMKSNVIWIYNILNLESVWYSPILVLFISTEEKWYCLLQIRQKWNVDYDYSLLPWIGVSLSQQLIQERQTGINGKCVFFSTNLMRNGSRIQSRNRRREKVGKINMEPKGKQRKLWLFRIFSSPSVKLRHTTIKWKWKESSEIWHSEKTRHIRLHDRDSCVVTHGRYGTKAVQAALTKISIIYLNVAFKPPSSAKAQSFIWICVG